MQSPSQGAPGNEPYKTEQNVSVANGAESKQGTVGSPSGVVAPNVSDDSAPGGNEPYQTVRSTSNNNERRNDHQVVLPGPSHDRTRSETPGKPAECYNQPRGSMSGSWDNNDVNRRTSGHWQNEDAQLSSGEGKGYKSGYTSKKNDGEEGPM